MLVIVVDAIQCGRHTPCATVIWQACLGWGLFALAGVGAKSSGLRLPRLDERTDRGGLAGDFVAPNGYEA